MHSTRYISAGQIAFKTGMEWGWNTVKTIQRTDFPVLSKAELQGLADGLCRGDTQVTSLCVEFVCAETLGVWHGRARAMMCRRMKHVGLDENQSARLVECISGRLASGRFSEQFKDQLRLALKLDAPTVFQVARDCRSSDSQHVRAYAAWVLSHDVMEADERADRHGGR